VHPTGCPHAYTLHSKRFYRIAASAPVHGIFMHLRAFGCEVWRGPGDRLLPSQLSDVTCVYFRDDNQLDGYRIELIDRSGR
jgi:hypothetical protein